MTTSSTPPGALSATIATAELDLGLPTLSLLRSRLPEVAEQTVQSIIVQVPAYTDALSGPIGVNIRSAVELALGGFLKWAGRSAARSTESPLAPALEGAYALGRGEARAGRSMEALLAAYQGRGESPEAHEVLLASVSEVGLDPARALEILAGDEYAAEVRQQEQFYQRAGIHSVPAVIINDRHLISGGQPAAVFEQALRQIAAQAAA